MSRFFIWFAVVVLFASCKTAQRTERQDYKYSALRDSVVEIALKDDTHEWTVVVETKYDPVTGEKEKETRTENHKETAKSLGEKSSIREEEDIKEQKQKDEKPDDTVMKEVTKSSSNFKWTVIFAVIGLVFAYVLFARKR